MREKNQHEDTICEEKKLCRNNERTTSAEDTQNQHYPLVLTVVDSFPKLLLVLRFTGMAGVYAPRPGLPPHRDTDIHQQITINFGRASITACVTRSTRVLDELLRDEGFNLFLQSGRFFSDADAPCSHEHLKQWDITVFLRHCISIHATMVHPPYRCTLCVHAGPDDLNVDCYAPVVGTTRRLNA